MRCPNCNSDVGGRSQCQACGVNVRTVGQSRHDEADGRQRGQQHRRNRVVPTGIKLAAALLGFLGVSLVFGGLVLGNAGGAATRYGATGVGSALGAVGIVLAGLGLADIAGAYGVWKLKRWGWTTAVGTLGIGTLSSLVVLVGGAAANGLVGLLLHCGVLGYLFTQRSHFGERPQPGRPTGGVRSGQGAGQNGQATAGRQNGGANARAGQSRGQQSIRRPR